MQRQDLSKKYLIGEMQWKRRHDDVMEHLRMYMDIKEVKSETGRYSYEIQGFMPIAIPPLDRKNAAQKVADEYEKYVKEALGDKWKPNQKSKIARDAIDDFAAEKYGHQYVEGVCRRYVKPIVDKEAMVGESVWVNYSNYMVLTEDQIRYLKVCFKQFKYTAVRAFEVTTKYFQGNEVEMRDLKGSYRSGIEMFKEKWGFYPVLVHWMKVRTHEIED